MKVFVTGGSGFIGGHVIETLVARGHTAAALARSAASAKTVESRGARAVDGDLATVSAAMLEGFDAIVHAAAFVEQWGTREAFFEANVRGTERMLDAARAAGVRRFIHIGTEAALFDGDDLVGIDEAAPYPKKQRYLYSETKALAEQRVLAAHREGVFEALVLRPRLVWGPRDTSILPALLEMHRLGRFAWLGKRRVRTSTTHVSNLAHAVDLALSKGSGGQTYFIADDGTLELRQFLSDLALTQGVDLGKKTMPLGVARVAATVVEGIWRLFGIRSEPPMTRFAIDMMGAEITVDTARAKERLGYAPLLTVAEGLAAL